MLLTLRLLAVPSLLLHVQGVDEEAKEWTGGGLESTIREAFRGGVAGVASVSQFMKKFNPNEKDFEFGHRANNIYLPPAPITPFRGGLRSVPTTQEEKDNNPARSSGEAEETVDASSLTSSRDAGDVQYAARGFSSGLNAWAPDEFPDPWSSPLLCGGALTSSLVNEGPSAVEDSNSRAVEDFIGNGGDDGSKQLRRPLICDPDQVLDKKAVHDVAMQLRKFAETFAPLNSPAFDVDGAEGDVDELEDDGADSKDDGDLLASGEMEAESRSLRSLRSLTSSENAHSEIDSSVGGIFSSRTTSTLLTRRNEEPARKDRIEVAVALVEKDLVNSAAQFFSRYLHSSWSRKLAQEEEATNIVLIFISTLDRICYISSGSRIASVLPWWRLEHVVQDMKYDLRRGLSGEAINVAIADISALLIEGPPTLSDRLDDFFRRFGVVLAFTVFTFCFATWGEWRDRKRILFQETETILNAHERKKARLLQRDFKTSACPICLEPFLDEADQQCVDADKKDTHLRPELKRVDSWGIPLSGSDGKPIKMLRCGHIFDTTCWKAWVDSGSGNPWACPVCRQSVTRTKPRMASHPLNGPEERSPLFTRISASTLRPLRNYSSIGSFGPLSHPSVLTFPYGSSGSVSNPEDESLANEETPLVS
ncbi:hypothetical protein THAOC_31708 [Thalassiosira oceanica]|uniref:RING-type domain-containing protein n=1 Tax=Thalassiosira oceanica TaxID=159749 RepID=K0RKH4_THAOC|nr:hypothetical protein THAOC_31708 [Thalassiosira oceanica]|eukprot:EJK49421.1 hypothetical protein THAOC_31708 [Thalassiosira oceanica]